MIKYFQNVYKGPYGTHHREIILICFILLSNKFYAIWPLKGICVHGKIWVISHICSFITKYKTPHPHALCIWYIFVSCVSPNALISEDLWLPVFCKTRHCGSAVFSFLYFAVRQVNCYNWKMPKWAPKWSSHNMCLKQYKYVSNNINLHLTSILGLYW